MPTFTTSLISACGEFDFPVTIQYIYNTAEPISNDREYGGCEASIDVTHVFEYDKDITTDLTYDQQKECDRLAWENFKSLKNEY